MDAIQLFDDLRIQPLLAFCAYKSYNTYLIAPADAVRKEGVQVTCINKKGFLDTKATSKTHSLPLNNSRIQNVSRLERRPRYSIEAPLVTVKPSQRLVVDCPKYGGSDNTSHDTRTIGGSLSKAGPPHLTLFTIEN